MKNLFLLLILFSATHFLSAQTIWEKNQTPSAVLQMPGEESLPTSFQLLELNTAVLKKAVSNAPLASNLVQRNNVAAQRNQQSCVDIPLPDGSIECFALEQTQLLPQVTQRRNNDIKTYRGRSLSNPKAIVHIVQTNDDFHLIGDSDQGTFLIDKVEKKDTKQPLYISYLAKDEQIEALECETAHEVERNAPVSSARNSESKKSFGTTLRKYRMAIMWSHVYTRKYDNNISQILARSAEIVADMNFICERDLCITFVLADNPEKIIFTDETTDPYDGELSSIFTTIRDSIGQANFDIGFGIAQGGNISYRGVTCEGQKSVTRSGDHIRAIAHELGHNMGAQHTFNYCEHGLAGIQVEVGSGHSIMSYNGTGVCGAGTVSGALVYRFHSRSVEEMYEQLYINTNCAEKIPTNNVPPVVGVPASGFYIPKSTPFVLTGTASDANTDLANLTYDWDQIDNGIGALPGQPNDKSPLFRLYAHSTSPTRTFPNIYNIVNNKYFSTGEKLPTISRSLNFRFQAQDNHPGGSGVAHEDLQFFVDGTKGPFVVTHPNLNETERIYSAGHDLNVTWDVANTQQAPVSCAIVNIYLSNDGGITYPFTLATNVPNDGAQQVVIPDAVGDNNRIKVAAADNIFFDISDRDFKIVAADTRDFVAYTDQATYDNCGSEEDITISLANYPLGTFDENISLSLTGLPANASLNMPSLINAEATTSITIGNIAQIPVGAYSLVLKLTAAGGGLSKNIPLQLTKQDNILTIAPDKAANFSGSSSRIVINKKSDFDFGTSGSFSVDLWLKPSNLDNTIRVIMGDYKLAKKIGWKLTMRDAKLYFSMERYNSKVEIISGKVLQNNKWQHIAVTVDRGVTNNVKVYRNGVVVASGGAGGIDITTPNALVVGAQDRYTKYEYNYKGQMDELNIWNRALSTEDVWKRAHVIVEHCDDGLISTYQFNETDGNQALDAFRGHHGRLGNVTREVSSAPFGKGAVSHQKEAAGLVNFAAAGFSAEYTKQRNIDVVASKIDLAPFNPSEGINPEDDILSGQYWIIRPYNGSADMEYDATFTLNDPISAQQASTAVAYKLYGRSVFSTGGWTFLTSASTADATNNSITFKGVKHYVQFLITRNEESLLFVEGEEELLFCATPQDAAGLQSYGISGINLPQDVAVTAPAGYQLATNPAGPFSPSLSLPLVDNALPYTLIYVKFEPTASGETQGIITHVAGTQSVDKTIKGIQVMPAQDIADQALQLDGTDAALKIVNGEDINLSGHTVELWFKPNWVDPFKHYNERWSTLFAKQQGTNSAISASVTGEQIRIRRGSSNTYIDHEFSSTRWYHLALVFSKNSTTVYINGVQLSNSAKAYNSGLSHYPIYLGGNGTDQFFEGKIDEFKIWNVGKSATQIREGMHLTSNLSSACEAGLRVYHQFDQMDSDGNMEDKLYYHPGTLVADAALAYSDVPAAEGVSVTKVVGDIGTYVFDKDGITTNLTIDYTTGAPSREVVVSYLTGEGAHGNFPTRGGLEDAYWIIKDYGIKEGGGMNVFIKNPAGWLINDNLTTNKVYKRRANAEDTNQWFEAGTVLDINLAEDIITLQDTVSNSLQLVPSRGYEGTCFDGILNGDEVDIDCGGSCPCVECDYTQIAYNNFDNGNAYTNSGRAQIYGIWNIPSNPTRLTTDAKWAKSGARSVKLSGNNSGGQGEFSTKNINLAGYDNLELDFWFTPTRFYRNNHVFYLEISTDGGASYSIVKTWEWSGEFTRNYNVFTFLDLPDDLEYTRYHENITINQPLTANTRLRFRTNLYYSAAVYLDNVKISTCKLPSCTDGVQNGTEVAIDCGGDCSSTCGLPTAMISGTTAVCKDEVAPAITFTGADGTAPYTFTYKINDGAAQTITTTAGNSTSVNHPTNVAGTFTYTLVRVQDADNGEQNQTGAVTATIEELPTASISGTTTVAQGAAAPNVTFTAADGTAPYTFTYKINNGAAQTITTTAGNSVSLTQSTASTGVFKYDLVSVTDDKGCSNAATGNALVTVNQLPTATISGTTAVCKDGVATAITFTGANGTAPYTFTYKINDGTEQIITTSAGNTIAIDHPANVAGIFTYTLVKVKDANNGEQNQTGTATATIEELPMASISGTTTVAQGAAAPSVTFTGTDGVAPYTFTYKINNGAAQTITTTAGNSVTLTQSTANTGVFKYDLVSIADNKGCSNTATGNALVTVNQLPTATISGTTAVCKDGVAPAITFTGANGTAPYTFTYKINDGTEQIITTSAGNTIAIDHPTNVAGIFTYTLVKVKDANNGEQNQTGTATATIEALPMASISGTTTVSQGDAAPNVTFTAAEGSAPYTFTYKINNGAAQSITTTAGNSVTVEQSTASVGMFEYELVSVTDNKSCSNAATGNAVVTVTANQLPTATISGTTTVCKDDTSPSITFIGANGTAPYTFTYKINDGAEKTITTTAGNSIAIDHPTNVAGTFTYTLVKVKDANNGEQNQMRTAITTVEELPTASISGTTTVAQGAAAPSVTFTAAEGNAPYTFTYKLNNGAAQTITTTASNTVTLTQSTANSGVFKYDLVSVTDNKGCSNAATGNAVVTVDGGGGSDCNTVINYSGFETGKWGFWKDGGRDARLTKAAPIAGSYSAILRKNSNTSVMTTKSLDLTMYNQIQVDFSYESIGFDNRSESFKLQVSTDNGSTFTTVNEWNLVDDFNNNETYEESVIINGPFSSTTKFRFRCNTNSVADAILLDNITVSGCQSTTGGGDNCLVGSVCDDGDATTINDVYDANCNCAGTPNSQGCTETDWINVAKGKPTSQSSTAFGGVSSRAVDGNTNGRWGQKSVTHTNFQNQAWWEVDLGQAVEIKDIRVWNRTDCCTNRLSDFDIIISNTQGGNDWMQHINNKPSPSVSVKPDKVGRYVRIQLKGTNYLSLAEVQVYTCPSQDLTENSSQSRRQIQPQLQFSAFKAKRAVDLQWVSNTGYKVASYEIERSDDGHNFHSIQQVPNTELTDELTFHSTTDAEPQKGVNFYRVKQIYSDGSHDYTEVQNIYFNIDLYTINIFPNPAQDELWIDLGQFTESKKSIRVFNRLGIAIEEITVSEMEGVQQLKLNTTSYQNGMYYLIIEADNQRISAQKFIIEHWK